MHEPTQITRYTSLMKCAIHTLNYNNIIDSEFSKL